MILADVGPRFVAGGILLLLMLLMLRDARNDWSGRLSALLALCILAFLITSSPFLRAMTGLPDGLLAVRLALPVLFWLTTLAVFTDDFRLRLWHGLPLLLVEATAFADNAAPAMETVHQTLVIGLYVLSLLAAWWGWRNDLVDSRRRFRGLFITTTTVVGLGIGVGQLVLARMSFFDRLAAAPVLDVVIGWVVAVLVMVIAWMILGVDARQQLVALRAPRSFQPAADDPKNALIQRLTQVMENDRLYQRHDLTPAGLAGRLGCSEHALRRVINGGLGHRNFNVYLNGYRIDQVKSALSDAQQAGIPIPTLALEAGFGSLAPFNRAFREATGMTPSDYRRKNSQES